MAITDEILNNNNGSESQDDSANTLYFQNSYDQYTISETDGFVPIITNNNTAKSLALSLSDKLVFSDYEVVLETASQGGVQILSVSNYNFTLLASDVLVFGDGNYAISWSGKAEFGASEDVYWQSFDSLGNEVNDYFVVNSGTENNQHWHVSTLLSDGNSAVVWQSTHAYPTSIYGSIIDSSGNIVKSEFIIGAGRSDYHARYPAIESLNDGGFVVTWRISEGYNKELLKAQVFDSNYTKTGSVITVTDSSSINSLNIINQNDSEFTVIWRDGSAVYAKNYDTNGNNTSDEVELKTGSSFRYKAEQISDSSYILVSNSGGSSNAALLQLQVYDFDNNKIGSELALSDSSDELWHGSVDVAMLNDERFVIVWDTADAPYEDLGRWQHTTHIKVFDKDLNEQLSISEALEGSYSKVDALSDGGFVVVSVGEDYTSIKSIRFDSEGNRLGNLEPKVLISSTANDDILQGTNFADSILTGLGADIVYAQEGSDVIYLTADSTWGIGYFAKNVSIDKYYTSVGTGEMISVEGLNRFTDVIDGGDDMDTLNLTAGNDAFFIDDVYSEYHSSISQNTGSSSVVLHATTQDINSMARVTNLETINAGSGDDIVDLTSTNFLLAFNLTYPSIPTAVHINGEAGNDILWSSGGTDTIDGGAGNDSLFGGTGNDNLTGGIGTDTFQFTATADSDVITDFDLTDDAIQLFYRNFDNHTYDSLSLSGGILTWSTGIDSDNVLIDMSATTTSSDLSDFDGLITFVEIV